MSTTLKRSWVDDAYDAAVAASISLRAQLRLWESAARSAVATGQIVAQTSSGSAAGNRSVGFSTPNFDGFSPIAIVEMVRELIDLNDEVVAELGVTDNFDNINAIKAEIMGQLIPVTEVSNDYAGLRTPELGTQR